MTFFDFLDKVGFYAKRFILPAIFLTIGIYLLVVATVPVEEQLGGADNATVMVNQSSSFLYASLFFLVASVVWILYLFNIIKSIVGYGIGIILVVCSSLLIYADFSNIKATVDFRADFEERDLNIKARMDDIKQAELAYREANGIYTNSIDELIDFVKTGKKMKLNKQGSIPERKISEDEREYLYHDNRPIDNLMTEVEAAHLALAPNHATDLNGFQRDTNYVPVLEAIFLDEKKMEARDKIGASFDFNVDSLRYVPFSKIPVKIDTASIARGDSRVPTIYIEMVHPLSDQLIDSVFYSIGKLTENSLRESWKEK